MSVLNQLGYCPDISYASLNYTAWPETGDCYVRLKISVTYEEAETRCAAFGSNLLIIRSPEEQQWVYDTFVIHRTSSTFADIPIHVWLGAKIHLTPWMWRGKLF